MGEVVEKVIEDVLDALDVEKTYGEIIEDGKEDLKLLGDAVYPEKMKKTAEKVSEDVIDAIEGEKTYGELIEDGKKDLKLLGEAVDGEKVKQVAEKVYSDVYAHSEDYQDIMGQVGQIAQQVMNNPG